VLIPHTLYTPCGHVQHIHHLNCQRAKDK
jgi:hypothetical protein